MSSDHEERRRRTGSIGIIRYPTLPEAGSAATESYLVSAPAIDRVAETVLQGAIRKSLPAEPIASHTERKSPILIDASGTSAVSLAVPKPSEPEDIDGEIARLPPVKRLSYMAQNDKWGLAISCCAAVASIYGIWTAIVSIRDIAISMLWTSAYAAQGSTAGSDTFNLAVLAVVAAIAFFCLFMIWHSPKPANVTYAKDVLKIILGFLGGVFGSGRAR